ncbi:MAG: PQQ-binding-like beta-propeller repeat protein, partial [Planctomycetota bacterium]|nr:PQQ-binding-like beta-propeller repeat protein [Planctomycetota bacterium]
PWQYGTPVAVQCSGLKTENGEALAGDLTFTPWPGRPAGRELLQAFLIGELRERVDPSKVVKTSLLDEAAVRPAEGAAWTRATADEGVFDLVRITGKRNNVAVHACVYLWSDAGREVQLWFGSDGGIRAVVNGKLVHTHAAGRGYQPDQDRVQGVPLQKGWNTLLLMISKTGNDWAFSARVMDAAGKEPAKGVCSLASRPEDSRVGLDAAPEAGPVADEALGFGFLDDLRPKIAELDALNDACMKAADWSRDEPRRKLAQSITDKVMKADRAYRVSIGWGGGNTGPTPVTDGQRVCAWFGETGVVACYDLDGRRVWTRFEQPGGGEHGINSSPVLVGRLLVLIAGDHWVAFDKATGQVAWRQQYHHPCYGTPVVTQIAGEAVLVAADGQVVRVSDGEVIAPSIGKFDGECASTVVDGNRFFLFARAGFCAAELPAKAERNAGTRVVRMIEPKVLDAGREPYPVGSPVCHDGILYAVRSGWGAGNRDVILYAFDSAAPEPIYRQKLDLEPVIFYGPEGGGVCASLAFAGGNIYVMDNRGTGLVFKPGREYKQVARFRLDHWMRWGGREVTGSSPVFEGRRIYLRGREMMYCIGDQ